MILFKDLKLTKSEILWIKTIYENNGVPNPQAFKVELFGKIPEGFEFNNLHRTFLWDNHLNMFGIWLINPKDPIFTLMDKVIKSIGEKFKKDPEMNSITAKEVTKLTKTPINDSENALGYLGQHGGFWSGGSNSKGAVFGFEEISFSKDGSNADAYLHYKDIPTLLEQTWAKFRLDLYIRPNEAETTEEQDKPKLRHTSLCNSVIYGKEIWTFHNNSAQVVQVLIKSYLNGLPDLSIREIHNNLPKEIESQSLSHIFKRADKNEDWKKLIVDGPSGKGFYRINPDYLNNGIIEIDLKPHTS